MKVFKLIRSIFVVQLSIIWMLLVGCQTTPKPYQTYSGPELPLDQIAVLKLVNVHVVSVDRMPINTAIPHISIVTLIPGEHRIAFGNPYLPEWGKVQYPSLGVIPKTLTLQSGKTYTVYAKSKGKEHYVNGMYSKEWGVEIKEQNTSK